MSESEVPLIFQVIPFMDSLTNAITKYQTDLHVDLAVRYAASRGRLIIDKYYAKSDDVAFYRSAMRK